MKKISTAVLCLLLAFCLILPVFAEEGIYVIQDDSVYVAGSGVSGTVASVSANGQQVAMTATTVEEAGLPVTYIVAVDCASGLSQEQKVQQTQILDTINQSMNPGDDMVLVYMTSKLVVGERLSTQEERTAALHAERPRASGTYLYDSIVSLTKLVADTETYPGINSIILVSSGSDLQATATNEKDAANAMRDCSVCVNTIALLDRYPDSYSKSRAVALRDLASASNGGVGICMSVDMESGADAAAMVMDPVRKGSVALLDTDSLNYSGETVELQVSSTTEAGTLSSTVQIPTAELPEKTVAVVTPEPEVTVPAETAAEPAPAEENTAEATTQTVTEPTAPVDPAVPTLPDNVPVRKPDASVKKNGDVVFYVLIAGGIVSLLAALVIVVLMLRRREDEEEEFTMPSDMEYMVTSRNFEAENEPIRIENLSFSPKAAEQPVSNAFVIPEPAAPAAQPPVQQPAPAVQQKAPVQPAPVAKQKPAAQPAPAVKPEPAAQPAPVVKQKPAAPAPVAVSVRITSVEDPTVALRFSLAPNSSMTIGRNTRSDLILNDWDAALSGLHFEMRWDGNALMLCDRNSTNGTILNKVHLQPTVWTRVENGDILRVGSQNYCVVCNTRVID